MGRSIIIAFVLGGVLAFLASVWIGIRMKSAIDPINNSPTPKISQNENIEPEHIAVKSSEKIKFTLENLGVDPNQTPIELYWFQHRMGRIHFIVSLFVDRILDRVILRGENVSRAESRTLEGEAARELMTILDRMNAVETKGLSRDRFEDEDRISVYVHGVYASRALNSEDPADVPRILAMRRVIGLFPLSLWCGKDASEATCMIDLKDFGGGEIRYDSKTERLRISHLTHQSLFFVSGLRNDDMIIGVNDLRVSEGANALFALEDALKSGQEAMLNVYGAGKFVRVRPRAHN